MDKVKQEPSLSKPEHRLRSGDDQSGASQGASPASLVMADGTTVMRLDNIDEMLQSLEKLDKKAE
jgi:hypothetical protein